MTRPDAPSASEIASWILAGLGMLFVLHFRLLPALLAGLLVCELVHATYPFVIRIWPTRRAKGIALSLVLLAVVGAFAAAIFGLVAFMRSEGGSLSLLLAKMAEIVEHSGAQLPQALRDLLPIGADGLRDTLSTWLRNNAAELQRIGKETGHSLARLLIGLIIGAIISLRGIADFELRGPLSRALSERCYRLAEAFRRIVFA